MPKMSKSSSEAKTKRHKRCILSVFLECTWNGGVIINTKKQEERSWCHRSKRPMTSISVSVGAKKNYRFIKDTRFAYKWPDCRRWVSRLIQGQRSRNRQFFEALLSTRLQIHWLRGDQSLQLMGYVFKLPWKTIKAKRACIYQRVIQASPLKLVLQNC